MARRYNTTSSMRLGYQHRPPLRRPSDLTHWRQTFHILRTCGVQSRTGMTPARAGNIIAPLSFSPKGFQMCLGQRRNRRGQSSKLKDDLGGFLPQLFALYNRSCAPQTCVSCQDSTLVMFNLDWDTVPRHPGYWSSQSHLPAYRRPYRALLQTLRRHAHAIKCLGPVKIGNEARNLLTKSTDIHHDCQAGKTAKATSPRAA